MLAKLIDMLSRPSRRPLALGVVLVSARGGRDPRPICYAQIRPASAWSSVLLLLMTLGLGVASLQWEVGLSSARSAAAMTEAAAVEASDAGGARLASESYQAAIATVRARRS
jgi:hypothetical protein